MPIQVRNLFDDAPVEPGGEQVELLLHRGGVRLERILSQAHASPPGFWYDQAEDEWVLLLAGTAVLRFDEPDERIELTPGDALLIPAHRRHRVERTAAEELTIWLTLHLAPAFGS